MNRERRKEIEEIRGKLAELWDRLDAVRAEEEEAYNNLPQSIQDSERGETMLTGLQALEDALDCIDDAKDALAEAVGE